MSSTPAERIAEQLVDIYVALLPAGEELQELLNSGVSPSRALSLYAISDDQWAAILERHFRTDERVSAFMINLNFRFNEIEARNSGQSGTPRAWREVLKKMTPENDNSLWEVRNAYKDASAMTSLVYKLSGEPLLPSGVVLDRLRHRCFALVEILLVAARWHQLPEVHGIAVDYEQQLRGVAISLGLQPLDFAAKELA